MLCGQSFLQMICTIAVDSVAERVEYFLPNNALHHVRI